MDFGMYGIQVMGLWAYWLRQHDFSSASNSFTQIIFLCYKLHYFPITPQTFFKNFCPAINDVISHHCCQFLFFHWLVDFLWNAYILLIFLWCQTSKHTKKTRQPLHSAYKLSWSKTSTNSANDSYDSRIWIRPGLETGYYKKMFQKWTELQKFC